MRGKTFLGVIWWLLEEPYFFKQKNFEKISIFQKWCHLTPNVMIRGDLVKSGKKISGRDFEIFYWDTLGILQPLRQYLDLLMGWVRLS